MHSILNGRTHRQALTAWLLAHLAMALLAAGGAWYLNIGRDTGHARHQDRPSPSATWDSAACCCSGTP